MLRAANRILARMLSDPLKWAIISHTLVEHIFLTTICQKNVIKIHYMRNYLNSPSVWDFCHKILCFLFFSFSTIITNKLITPFHHKSLISNRTQNLITILSIAFYHFLHLLHTNNFKRRRFLIKYYHGYLLFNYQQYTYLYDAWHNYYTYFHTYSAFFFASLACFCFTFFRSLSSSSRNFGSLGSSCFNFSIAPF